MAEYEAAVAAVAAVQSQNSVAAVTAVADQAGVAAVLPWPTVTAVAKEDAAVATRYALDAAVATRYARPAVSPITDQQTAVLARQHTVTDQQATGADQTEERPGRREQPETGWLAGRIGRCGGHRRVLDESC